MMGMARGLERELAGGLVTRHDLPEINWIHADRTFDSIPFKKDFSKLFSNTGIIRTLSFAISREKSRDLPFEKGFPPGTKVHFGHCDASFIKESVFNVEECVVYLCGPNPFMAAMTAALGSLGVLKKLILVENFEY